METTPEKQIIKENNLECPDAPKKEKTNINVVVGNISQVCKPFCLGTFMGAMEAYHRGMELTQEEKQCLIHNNIIK